MVQSKKTYECCLLCLPEANFSSCFVALHASKQSMQENTWEIVKNQSGYPWMLKVSYLPGKYLGWPRYLFKECASICPIAVTLSTRFWLPPSVFSPSLWKYSHNGNVSLVLLLTNFLLKITSLIMRNLKHPMVIFHYSRNEAPEENTLEASYPVKSWVRIICEMLRNVKLVESSESDISIFSH